MVFQHNKYIFYVSLMKDKACNEGTAIRAYFVAHRYKSTWPFLFDDPLFVETNQESGRDGSEQLFKITTITECDDGSVFYSRLYYPHKASP